jgi:hypothetical protein
MVPGIATTVGVDLLVPCGDAIGVAPATSMVGQATCCVVTYVVVVFVELRFIVGRRQPRWLWERVVGSHGGGGHQGAATVARRLHGWKVFDRKVCPTCRGRCQLRLLASFTSLGRHHGGSPSSWSSGLAELHLFLVHVCVVALLPHGSFDVLHGMGGGPLGDPVGNPATSRSRKGSLGGTPTERWLMQAASSVGA